LALDAVGHGRFAVSYELLLDVTPNEVAILYQDTITRNRSITLPLPLPPGVTGNVEIRWTLA
jgi:hypothetical protein